MRRRTLLSLFAATFVAHAPAAPAQDPTADEVAEAVRRAVEFYRNQVSTRGGYHYHYTHDLSYGRSEHGEGPTQVEVQRDGTPLVGMTYLDAYHATGDRYYLDAARETAHALVQGQLCSGAWSYLIEFDPAKRKDHAYRVDGCEPARIATLENTTTLDDNVSQGALRLLMRVDAALDQSDPAIHEPALYALERLMEAQYPNGAWPQRFTTPPSDAGRPILRASYPESWSWTWPGPDYDYREHYTFNDNTLSDLIDLFLEAARIYDEPRYRATAEKGGEFILLAQMPDPQPGWAQQYDERMHPAWARVFEPPSISGGEAQGIMKTLMVLYRETGDRKYLEPIPRALRYYLSSTLPPVDEPAEIRARACPPGTEYCLARFYELKTNRPLYVTKGTQIRVTGLGSLRPDGYELSYSDSSVITHYGVLVAGNQLDEIGREYEELVKGDPRMIRRREVLSGLSPWAAPLDLAGGKTPAIPPVAAPEPDRVRRIIAALDSRGAWTEEGYIGRDDRLVYVFAARPMTVRLGDRTHTMRENDVLEVYRGTEPPRERIISTATFSDNVGLLLDYLRAAPRAD